jgi:hypothetical protein
MTLFVALVSVFNLMLAAASAGRASRLMTKSAASEWASRRLLGFARLALWTIPLAAIAANAAAWRMLLASDYPHWAAPIVLAPLALVLLLGAAFAVIDFAEDGVLDFGRGPKSG